jgi:cytochrome d ubiquinol oxidase subunit II
LRPYYTGSFFGLLNPFALLAGSSASDADHAWRHLAATAHREPIATRAKQWAKVTGLITIGAFALAGIWLSIGIDGFRVVSMPELGATPNPLTKEVVIDPSAWLANYWTIR